MGQTPKFIMQNYKNPKDDPGNYFKEKAETTWSLVLLFKDIIPKPQSMKEIICKLDFIKINKYLLCENHFLKICLCSPAGGMQEATY